MCKKLIELSIYVDVGFGKKNTRRTKIREKFPSSDEVIKIYGEICGGREENFYLKFAPYVFRSLKKIKFL